MISINEFIADFGWSTAPLTALGSNVYGSFVRERHSDVHKVMFFIETFNPECSSLDKVIIFDYKDDIPLSMAVYDYGPH